MSIGVHHATDFSRKSEANKYEYGFFDRVPRRGVALAVAVLPDRAGNGSACGWQADERIIAHRGDCLKCHVAGPLDGPFVVLFEQQRTD